MSGSKCQTVLHAQQRPTLVGFRTIECTSVRQATDSLGRRRLDWDGGGTSWKCVFLIERCRLLQSLMQMPFLFSTKPMHGGSGREGKFNSLFPTSRLQLAGTIRVYVFSFLFSSCFSRSPMLPHRLCLANRKSRHVNHSERHS